MEKALASKAVQDLIRTITNDTMRERDRTVSIRIDPDGAISINIYPITEDGGETDADGG